MSLHDIETSFDQMPDNEAFICSYSGGKDSAIALSMACDRGTCVGLLHWTDEGCEETVFHVQDLSIINKQAECMGLPLYNIHFVPWKNRIALLDFYKMMSQQGVRSVIFGDIFLPDSVKFQSILCTIAGLTPRYPLWKRSYDDLITEMETRKVEAIITRVNTSYLDRRYLGRTFDRDVYNSFCAMSIDPFGEHGEYHTTVVNADIFKETMSYTIDRNERAQERILLKLSSHQLENNIYRLINPKC